MVNLIVGPRKSGKSTYLNRAFHNAINKGDKSVYIVPELGTLTKEETLVNLYDQTSVHLGNKEDLKEYNLFDSQNIKGLINCEVTSFKKIAYTYLKRTSLRSKVIIDKKREELILRKVLFSLDKELVSFKGAYDKKGLLKKILEEINALCEYDVSLNVLKELEEHKEIYEKLQELNLIKEAYLDSLMGNYITNDQYYKAFIEELRSKDNIHEFRIEDVSYFFDDFYHFTKGQMDIMKVIMSLSKETYITVPISVDLVDELNKLSVSENIKNKNIIYDNFEELVSYLRKEDIKYNIVTFDETYYDSDNIKALEENFFFDLKKIKGIMDGEEKKEDIELKSFTSYSLEVDYVLNRIKKFHLVNKVPYESMLIVSNDLEKYRDHLLIKGKEYGVPLYIKEKKKLSEDPFFQYILSLLELIRNKYAFLNENIFNILKNPFFDLEDSQVEKIENYALSTNMEFSKWTYKYNLEKMPEIKVVIEFIRDLEKTINMKSVGSFLKSFHDFISKKGIYEQVLQMEESLNEREEYINSYVLKKGWNSYLDALESMYDVFSLENNLNDNQIIDFLVSVLESYEINYFPLEKSMVSVIPCSDAFIENGDYVFVLGGKDGVFPKIKEENPIFPMEEEEIIGELFPRGRSREFNDNKSFLEMYFTLSCANKYLGLTYNTKSDDDELIKLNGHLKELYKDYLGLEVEEINYENEGDTFYGLRSEIAHILKMVYGNGEELIRILGAIGSIEGLKVENKKIISIFKDLIEEEKRNLGNISSAIAQEVFLQEEYNKITVTKLESYGSCPFSFLINYGIKPKIMDSNTIDQRLIGNISHYILEKFHLEYLNKLGNLSNEEIKDFVFRESNKYFKSEEFMNKFQKESNVFHLEYIVNELVTLCIYINKEQETSKFKSTYFEEKIGYDDDFSDSFEVAGNKYLLQGKIDRVDIFTDNGKDYGRIIDYKLSNKQIDFGKINYGLSYQLFLYMDAIIKKKNLESASLYYLTIGEKNTNVDFGNLSKKVPQKKLSGLNIGGQIVIEGSDPDYVDGLKKNKEGVSLDPKKSLDHQEVKKVIDHLRQLRDRSLINMSQGEFAPNPYTFPDVSGSDSCIYCQYGNICKKRNKYQRFLKKISKEDFFGE